MNTATVDATQTTIAAAISHAQNIVNAAANLHTAAAARLKVLVPIAPALQSQFLSYTGDIHSHHVAFAVCKDEVPEALGIDRPAILAPDNRPLVDDRSDRDQGVHIGALRFGPEKKKAKTKAFPIDLPARDCYQVDVTVYLSAHQPMTTKVTAYPDQSLSQN